MLSNLLPFARPDIDGLELDEVRQTLESGWIAMGPKVQRFEQEFSRFIGCKHAVAVQSCTAALHLALEAAGLQRGDFVITTPYTFAATAQVIRYFDAVPVFADVEVDTLNIDSRRVAETIEDLDRTLDGKRPSTRAVERAWASRHAVWEKEAKPALKAIVPVHLAGQPCDMQSIARIVATRDLPVIEDAAHALPAVYEGCIVGRPYDGTLRGATCFSFYATKNLTTGDGGMITTEHDDWAERFRSMRLHGISAHAWERYSGTGHWYYEITAPGYKYDMTDIAASIGLAQLTKVERMWKRRQHIAQMYNEAFEREEALEIPSLRPSLRHSWHLYMLRLNLDLLAVDRGEFIAELTQRNVGVSVHFIPLHLHPYYRHAYGYEPEDFPVAYREYQREISLPIYSRMSDADVQHVIGAVIDTAHRSYRRSSFANTGL